MERLILIARLAVLGLLAAVPARAEAPFCFWDPEARRFAEWGEFGSATLGTYGSSFVASVYDTAGDQVPAPPVDEVWGVLHHCDSDNYLAFRSTGDEPYGAARRFYELLDAPDPVTMDELAEALRAHDAEVWVGTGGIGDCDCWIAKANDMFE